MLQIHDFISVPPNGQAKSKGGATIVSFVNLFILCPDCPAMRLNNPFTYIQAKS
jgi:hypothetical protein